MSVQIDVEKPAKKSACTTYMHIHFCRWCWFAGAVWPSATQEEVLFSARPEAMAGIAACATMAEDEAILISGANRHGWWINRRGFDWRKGREGA